MKTNLEWLQEMDEPERSQAIENCKNDEDFTGDQESSSIYYALSDAFVWKYTPEGSDYWYEISKKYYNGEY